MIDVLRNKELSLINIITLGWKVFKDNFISILIITLITYLPVIIIYIPISTSIALTLFQRQPFSNTFWVVVLPSFVLATILMKLITMSVRVIVEQYIFQNHTAATARQKALSALKKGFSRFGAAIVTDILYIILYLSFNLLFLLLALLINFIISIFDLNPFFDLIFSILIFFVFILIFFVFITIFLVNTAFYGLAVVLRKQIGRAALSYSKSVVQGRWWKVFFLSLVVQINALFIAVPLGFMDLFLFSKSYSLNIFITMIHTIPINLSIILLIQIWQVIFTIFFLNLDLRRN